MKLTANGENAEKIFEVLQKFFKSNERFFISASYPRSLSRPWDASGASIYPKEHDPYKSRKTELKEDSAYQKKPYTIQVKFPKYSQPVEILYRGLDLSGAEFNSWIETSEEQLTIFTFIENKYAFLHIIKRPSGREGELGDVLVTFRNEID